MANHESAAPTGHIEGFAGGVEFETDLLGSWNGEEAEGFSLENERGVGGIVDDDEFFSLGKSDDFLEELWSRGGPSGVIGIVEYKNLRFLENRARNGIEAREILIFWGEEKRVNDSAVVGGVGSEDRVSRAGHEDDISWIDEGSGQDGKSGFAADRVHNFTFGIGGHSEDFF